MLNQNMQNNNNIQVLNMGFLNNNKNPKVDINITQNICRKKCKEMTI